MAAAVRGHPTPFTISRPRRAWRSSKCPTSCSRSRATSSRQQTLLDDAKLVAPTGNPADDATLAKVKQQLLETIAFQNSELDIINGFVQTLQMGELQHVGEEYLGQISGSDLSTPIIKPTPNQFQDPNTPGIPQNPYNLDVTAIPGLVLGYNPLTKVMQGLQWLQVETGKREDAAGKTITTALSTCGNK